MRSDRLVVLGLIVAALPGCISYCDCAPWLSRASQGDPAAINELAELGRPRIPTSAIPLAGIEDAFVAIVPNTQSPDPYVRELAVDALRRLAERAPDVFRDRHVAAFDHALLDPLANVRYRAAWALGRVEITRPPLRTLARDPAPHVAAMACWALGRARDDEALVDLAAALDRGGPVRAAALAALERTTGHGQMSDQAWKAFTAEEAKRLEGIRKDRERIEVEQRAREQTPIAPIASPSGAAVASPTPPGR
jgi:HEAT repeat protein